MTIIEKSVESAEIAVQIQKKFPTLWEWIFKQLDITYFEIVNGILKSNQIKKMKEFYEKHINRGEYVS